MLPDSKETDRIFNKAAESFSEISTYLDKYVRVLNDWQDRVMQPMGDDDIGEMRAILEDVYDVCEDMKERWDLLSHVLYRIHRCQEEIDPSIPGIPKTSPVLMENLMDISYYDNFRNDNSF